MVSEMERENFYILMDQCTKDYLKKTKWMEEESLPSLTALSFWEIMKWAKKMAPGPFNF